MSKDALTFTQAGVLNDQEIAVEFSNGATVIVSIEQLLACVPDRVGAEDPADEIKVRASSDR